MKTYHESDDDGHDDADDDDDDDDKGDKDIPWEWSARCRQRFCEAVHFWGNMARELRWLGFSRCRGLSLQTQVLDAPPRPAQKYKKIDTKDVPDEAILPIRTMITMIITTIHCC